MNNEALIKIFKQYPIASTAFIIALVAIALLYFRWSAYPEMQQRLASLEDEWEKMETNLFKNSVNLEEHLASIKTISEDAKSRFIERTELGRNYRYFYGIENATGARIASLEQVPPSTQPARQRGQRQKEQAEPVFSKVRYNMTINGSYTQVLAFLGALENGVHIYELNTLTCQKPARTETNEISATLNFDILGHP